MYRLPAPPSDSSGISTRWSWGNPYVYGGGNVVSRYVSKYSVKTAGYKNLRASRAKLPINQFVYIEEETFFTPGGYGRPGSTVTNWSGYIYNHVYATNISPLPTSNDVADEAYRAASSNVLQHLKRSSINLAQSFAERRQTAGLLVTNINRLASVALAIRKGKLNHAHSLLFNEGSLRNKGRLADLLPGRKVLGKGHGKIRDVPAAASNLSNYWLEYAYGWRPLLQDIYGAAELIANTYEVNRPSVVTGVGKASASYPRKAISRIDYNSFEYAVSKVEAKAKFIIGYRVDDNAAALMSSTGITDPALLAWELLPYSFVMDWFVPVGTFLSNLTATRGLIFDSGCIVRQLKEDHQTDWVGTDDGSSNYLYYGNGRRIKKFTFSRYPVGAFPGPPLLEPKPLDWNKYASGLSLLTQLFTKSNKQRVI